MTISRETINALHDAGFTLHEITLFNEADNPIDVSMSVVRQMLVSRKKWIDKLTDTGWSKEEIAGTIRNYYIRKSDTSPYDFLKAEYMPPKKTDFQEARRRKAKASTDVLYKQLWKYYK